MAINCETLTLFYRERKGSTTMRSDFPINRFEEAKSEYEEFKRKNYDFVELVLSAKTL
ncbi:MULTISPECIES: hypothetical protein [Bacillus cereus group]|uniref:hypothetical protein n=1 Tax=Bacillus cereus group TaxID=86661 RepID=UPI0004182BEB|nr:MULTISPECIES: hypothetical protein [Bacillus cereus group]QUG93743.1 hypothetical protein HCM98_01695 [Bacillus tropicus]